MANIQLKGITWGHSRGITPLKAYAQRFMEKYPEVEISWRARTLQEFADFPIEKLTESYDLLIIDHPWVGCADATRCVLPLNEYLPKSYLQDQKEHSVGFSHESYAYGAGQWALAIDAATPVASYRKDLFEQEGRNIPETWQELLALAEDGKVAAPAIPIDLLMNFYMFCIAHGKKPFESKEEVIEPDIGLQALQTMQTFYGLLDRQFFDKNPIAVAELMSSTNDFLYCPFAYGYSNYSRTGFAPYILHYTGLVKFHGMPLQSTLGGTGLAVSAFSKQKEWAVKYIEEIMSPEVQITFYTEHGGQPGYLKAWQRPLNDQLTNGYFGSTLEILQNAYVRPRYNGYLHFQDHAGDPIRTFLMKGGQPEKVLEEMNSVYKESLKDQ